MSELHAISPGILLALILWALWYLLDPGLRAEALSWPRLLLWLAAPFSIYLVVATRGGKAPAPTASPVGKEGVVVQLKPLQVEVFGSFWQARCDSAAVLRQGDRIRVVERDGLTLVVKRDA